MVWGGVSPSLADYEVWGSVVSGVRGGAPAEKRVLEYLELAKTHLIGDIHKSVIGLFEIFAAYI